MNKTDDEYVVVNHTNKNNENSENDNDSSNNRNDDANDSKQIMMSILADMINQVVLFNVLQHNNENKIEDRNTIFFDCCL